MKNKSSAAVLPAKLQFNPENYLTEFLFSSKTRKNLTVHKGKVKVKIICSCLDCRYAHVLYSAFFLGVIITQEQRCVKRFLFTSQLNNSAYHLA